MATLTGELISETYDALLKVSDNQTITGVKKRITDGFGNETPLLISSTDLEIDGNFILSDLANASVDTDKFLVLDNTTVKYRTGSQMRTDIGAGTVNSVALTMPSAFSVANSPITDSGTLEVTAIGLASQYIRGNGTLADFPTSGGGGGSSVSYYLNGSVAQGTFVGNAYKEMNKTPVLGTGTDFTINANGYIAQFITDAADPGTLLIPAGNWNFETYFSASSGGGTPSFYTELYKYDGTSFTLIASNSTNPELISFGTSIQPYFSNISVPETVLTLTDRLAIRVYVTHSGRTITLHTEDNHLCQVITTFTTGLQSLNGLTKQAQYFAVGSTGTDFNISSSVDTHTFNLPTASASNRGVLSSANWTTFNNKQNAISLTTTGSSGSSTFISNTLNVPTYTLSGLGGVPTSRQLTINGTAYDLSADRSWSVGTVTSVAALTLGTSGTDLSSTVANGTTTPVITLNVPTASASNRGVLSSTDWTTFNSKQGTITLTTTGSSGAATFVSNTLNIPQYTVLSLAAIGITPNANGGSIVGSLLSLQPADASFGGVVTTGTQTFAGDKTLTGSLYGIGLSMTGTVGDIISSVATTGKAIRGTATTGFGVYASATTGTAIYGESTGTGGAALSGTSGNGIGGYFLNNATGFATLYVTNNGSGNLASFSNSAGTKFTINNAGNLGNGTYTYTLPSATGTLALTSAIPANPVGGTGTTNYVPKFTAASTIGNSLIFDNGTRVGINTASISNTILTIYDGTGNGDVLKIDTNATKADIWLNDSGSTSGAVRIRSESNSLKFIAGSDIRLTIASTGAATFSSSVTATGRISVQGTNQNSLWLNQNAGGTSSGFLIGRSLSTTDSQDFFIYDVAAAATRLVISSTGNVGIGQTIPTQPLEVRTGTDKILQILASGDLQIQSINDAKTANVPLNIVGSTLALKVGATTALSIASTGAATFSSRVTTGGGDGKGLIIEANSSALTIPAIGFNIQTGYNVSYINSYNVSGVLTGIYIGSSLVNISSLGTGTVTATAGTLSTVSDSAYKIDAGFIDSALDKVMNLKPRYFYWNDKSGLPEDVKQLGFYAQEVNSALGEEAANTPATEDIPWGISDRSVIAMLTKAIQEQQAQIEELKALIKPIIPEVTTQTEPESEPIIPTDEN